MARSGMSKILPIKNQKEKEAPERGKQRLVWEYASAARHVPEHQGFHDAAHAAGGLCRDPAPRHFRGETLFGGCVAQGGREALPGRGAVSRMPTDEHNMAVRPPELPRALGSPCSTHTQEEKNSDTHQAHIDFLTYFCFAAQTSFPIEFATNWASMENPELRTSPFSGRRWGCGASWGEASPPRGFITPPCGKQKKDVTP